MHQVSLKKLKALFSGHTLLLKKQQTLYKLNAKWKG